MASGLMTTEQVEAHVNSGLDDLTLQRYIDAADADIRRLIAGPLDNLRFSGVVVRATFTKGSGTTLRAADSNPVPGGDIKVVDDLTLGHIEYADDPDYTLTVHRSADSTSRMDFYFPTTSSYPNSLYVVDGESYAELLPRYLYESDETSAKWYVEAGQRPAIEGLSNGDEFEFVIAKSGATPLLPSYRSILVDLVRLVVEYDGLQEEEVGGRAGYRSVRRDYQMERSKVLTRLMVTQGRPGVMS